MRRFFSPFFTRYAPSRYAQIMRIAVPLILIGISQIVMQFCDRKFLSIISSDALAATVPAGSLAFTAAAFFLATCGFCTPMVAQAHGRSDAQGCARLPYVSMRFAMLATLLFALVIVPLCVFYIAHNGHTPELISLEKQYFLSLAPGSICAFFTVSLNGFFTGRGITWVPSAIQVGMCALNVFLNYVMIFGHFGCPSMGILGAGLATSISNLAALVATALIFLFQNQKRYPTRKFKSFTFIEFKTLIANGSAAGVHLVSDMLSFTVVIMLIGSLGPTEMTISSIAFTINMIAFMPLIGIADSVCVVVGNSIGQKRIARAGRTPYAAWQMALVYNFCTATTFILIPRALCAFFAPDVPPDSPEALAFAKVIDLSPQVLTTVALYCFFDSMCFIFNAALRGAGDTKVPMIIVSFICWGMMVPIVWMLVTFEAPLIWIWIYLDLHVIFLAFALYARFRYGAWKKIKLPHAAV